MNIVLVDDEPAIVEMVRRCVGGEVTPDDEASIFTYTHAEDVLRMMDQGSEIDILISDIDMPDMGGLELGKRIQERAGRTYLVFLTAYLEYAAESYVIEAYQYILKEDMEKRLPPILRQLIDRVKREKAQFRMIGTPTSKVQVYYRDIISIETERIALKQLIKSLESDEFLMVERGYIINITHIANMKGNMIEMDNGAKIIVNRANYKKAREQICLYRGKL